MTAPTLLVGGSRSRPWFAENSARLAAWLPESQTVTLSGADHLAPLTHPAELAAVIAGFHGNSQHLDHHVAR